MNRTFILIALIAFAGLVAATPYIPADDAYVVERLPPQRAAWTRQPKDAHTAARLARDYLQQARTDADPRYLGYAQAVLAPWARHAAPPAEIRVLRAMAAQSLHEFDVALRDLDAVLQQEPRHAQARLTRAAVHQARGELAAARADCVLLAGVAPEPIVQGCIAAVDALTGDAAGSYARLARLRTQLSRNDRDLAPWLDGLLAEFAQRNGDTVRAEHHYKAALAIAPDDMFLRTLYADYLLDQKRAADVVALLRDHTRADGALLRYAIAQRQLNAGKTSELTATLNARFAEARARGTALHLREEAMFALHLLDDAPRALQLAQENWRSQREPADARILLEAARAAGDVRAAGVVVDWMKRQRVRDPLLEKLAEARA